jgi:hypothetical protein
MQRFSSVGGGPHTDGVVGGETDDRIDGRIQKGSDDVGI